MRKNVHYSIIKLAKTTKYASKKFQNTSHASRKCKHAKKKAKQDPKKLYKIQNIVTRDFSQHQISVPDLPQCVLSSPSQINSQFNYKLINKRGNLRNFFEFTSNS